MKTSLELMLMECLDALEQGIPFEQVLMRYPNDSKQLRPMLETAVRLSKLNVQPSLAAKSRSRSAFLAEAAALKETRHRRPSPWFSLRRTLLPIASLVMILLIFGVGLIPLSAAALPGDALYGAKRLIEDAQLTFTANPTRQAALSNQFQQQRIEEINRLLATDRAAQVAFEGMIEAVQPGEWMIAGLGIQITDDTQIIGGDPVIGQSAMVNGRTQSGILVATMITLSPADDLPTATPTATSTPTATFTSTPTETPEPTDTVVATDTPSPTATLTAIPTEEADDPTATIQPTASPTFLPLPTATPTPSGDDNSNDNSNDNGNDNSNDNGGDNSNDNGGDDNSNDNGGDNSNDNGGDNSNDNSNDNNDNSNDNNDNCDSNSNDNGNDNGNGNNDDCDDNSNDNDNDDSNSNSSSPVSNDQVQLFNAPSWREGQLF